MTAGASDEAAALLGRLLGAARSKSLDVSEHLHPAWLQMAWQRIGLGLPTAPAARRACSGALAAVYGLQWASLTSFRHRAHRVALLPRPEIIRVLSAVALHADRERVRRCIVRAQRALVVERIGEAAYASLLTETPQPGAPAGTLTLDDLDAERLASTGYALLSGRGEWRCKTTLAWVRLALAPGESAPGAAPARQPADSHSILNRLSLYFPEHAWLFGSHMDRALSASMTA